MTIDEVRLLGDALVLSLTLDGEASGEPVEGQIAVGSVIRNRFQSGNFGATVTAVCLADRQFSCWLEMGGAANHARVMARAAAIADGQTLMDPPFRQCRYVASGILSGEVLDNTHGALHYVSAALYNDPKAPAWVKQARVLARIGHQVFMV